MVRVLEEIDVTRPQQLVLLSMAENARDDGSKCFPSVDLIAWKAGYKPRAVTDIMRDLRKAGILEVVQMSSAQRPTEYHIHLDRAPQKPSFEAWQSEHGRHIERAKKDVSLARENAPVQSDEGCNITYQGVHSHERGVQSHVSLARENAPEPVSEPVKNQSGNRSLEAQAPSKPKTKRATQVPDEFPIDDRWIAWGIDNGITVDDMRSQVPQFQDHYRSKGEPRKDWDATFRTWMRNAKKWGHLASNNVTTFQGSKKNDNGWSPYDIADYARELERQGL